MKRAVVVALLIGQAIPAWASTRLVRVNNAVAELQAKPASIVSKESKAPAEEVYYLLMPAVEEKKVIVEGGFVEEEPASIEDRIAEQYSRYWNRERSWPPDWLKSQRIKETGSEAI